MFFLRQIDKDKPSMDTNLSYEERAALRKAERDRRMREYAAATSISGVCMCVCDCYTISGVCMCVCVIATPSVVCACVCV